MKKPHVRLKFESLFDPPDSILIEARDTFLIRMAEILGRPIRDEDMHNVSRWHWANGRIDWRWQHKSVVSMTCTWVDLKSEIPLPEIIPDRWTSFKYVKAFKRARKARRKVFNYWKYEVVMTDESDCKEPPAVTAISNMATLTIDLKKNTDVADLVAAMSVGDGVDLKTTIKSKDDQTLVLTLEEATEGEKYEGNESEDDDDDDDDDDSEDDEDQDDPRVMAPPPPMDRTNY